MVADARASAQADAEPDRRKHDVVALLIVDSGTGDPVEAAVNTGKALEDRRRSRQVIDEHEYLRDVAAEIEADRWSLPPHPAARAVGHHQRAVSVAQTDGDGARSFFAFHVAIRASVILERFFDDLGEPFGAPAEKRLGVLQHR